MPETPDEPEVITERRDAVLVVRINRPAKRNAMSPALNRRMMEVLDELEFHAGAWMDASGVAPESPRFLDVIPIRFGMSQNDHYHVPLLVSPFGYSTYRGS